MLNDRKKEIKCIILEKKILRIFWKFILGGKTSNVIKAIFLLPFRHLFEITLNFKYFQNFTFLSKIYLALLFKHILLLSENCSLITSKWGWRCKFLSFGIIILKRVPPFYSLVNYIACSFLISMCLKISTNIIIYQRHINLLNCI